MRGPGDERETESERDSERGNNTGVYLLAAEWYSKTIILDSSTTHQCLGRSNAVDGPASLRCNALLGGVCVCCVVALHLRGFYITLSSHTFTVCAVIPWGKNEKLEVGVHGQNWTEKTQSSTLIFFGCGKRTCIHTQCCV